MSHIVWRLYKRDNDTLLRLQMELVEAYNNRDVDEVHHIGDQIRSIPGVGDPNPGGTVSVELIDPPGKMQARFN